MHLNTSSKNIPQQNWLGGLCLTSNSRIIHSEDTSPLSVNDSVCSSLTNFEQEGIFIVPCLHAGWSKRFQIMHFDSTCIIITISAFSSRINGSWSLQCVTSVIQLQMIQGTAHLRCRRRHYAMQSTATRARLSRGQCRQGMYFTRDKSESSLSYYHNNCNLVIKIKRESIWIKPEGKKTQWHDSILHLVTHGLRSQSEYS